MLFHQRATAEEGGTRTRCSVPQPVRTNSPGGVQASVQTNFSSNYVYFKREYLPLRQQVKEETMSFLLHLLSVVKAAKGWKQLNHSLTLTSWHRTGWARSSMWRWDVLFYTLCPCRPRRLENELEIYHKFRDFVQHFPSSMDQASTFSSAGIAIKQSVETGLVTRG